MYYSLISVDYKFSPFILLPRITVPEHPMDWSTRTKVIAWKPLCNQTEDYLNNDKPHNNHFSSCIKNPTCRNIKK